MTTICYLILATMLAAQPAGPHPAAFGGSATVSAPASPADPLPPAFVGVVTDEYRSTLSIEIESPHAEGTWLPAGEAKSAGTRRTEVAAVEGARQAALHENRWSDVDGPPTTTSWRLASLAQADADAGDPVEGLLRRRLAGFDRLTSGGGLCASLSPPPRLCPELGDLLPFPEMTWVVDEVSGATLTASAQSDPARIGVPISSLSLAIEMRGPGLAWTVRGEGTDPDYLVQATREDGQPVTLTMPARFHLLLEGTRLWQAMPTP